MTDPAEIAQRLWAEVDELMRAHRGMGLSASAPLILGLIFLRYADVQSSETTEQLRGSSESLGNDPGLRPEGFFVVPELPYDDVRIFETTEQLRGSSESLGSDPGLRPTGVFVVPESARFPLLYARFNDTNDGRVIDGAMKDFIDRNPELGNVLPRGYDRFEPATLWRLVNLIRRTLVSEDSSVLLEVFKHLLRKFAEREDPASEGVTPRAVTQLLVEILRPVHGLVYDPCCGVGDTLVESARSAVHSGRSIRLWGTDVNPRVLLLAAMNLAIHGLFIHGWRWVQLRAANALHSDVHMARFDFVVADPPFNQSGIDRYAIRDEERFPFGMPAANNANYLWIQVFFSALNERGRAGFVMAPSAADARGDSLRMRRQLIETGTVDAIVALGSNLFGKSALPASLWFLDKGKANGARRDRVLFVDARAIYRQKGRSKRDFAPEHIEYLANIVRLHRGEDVETAAGSGELIKASFPAGAYQDVPGLCKAATLQEIEARGWSLNPGRYVGVADAAAVRLRRMRLTNVYGFRNLDLRCPEGQVAVLIGANGAGKSTVLESIAMFLAPLSALVCDQSPRRAPYGLTKGAIHVEADLAEAELDVLSGNVEETWHLAAARSGKPALDPAMARWARLRRKAIEENPSGSVPVLCYYPAVRFYLHEGFQKRRARPVDAEIPQLAAYDNAFELGQQSFEGVVEWFRREEDLENEVRLRGESGGLNPRLDAVRQAVLRFMDRLSSGTYDELRVRRDPADASKAGLVLRKEGQELDLHNLSDGERGCLVLVADLAQRLAAANPGAPDPLTGVGIVLIDELELHLHPRWQREILPALCDTFPGCQLIVATHSPHVLSRVPREQVLLLSRFQVVERLPHTEGRDANAILTELMGLPSKRPEDAAEAIEDLARLVDREDLPAAHRKLAELENRFGPDDQDLLRLGAMMRALEDAP